MIPTPLTHLRILIVENHPDTSTYLRIYLEQMEHSVELATTMTEALELAEKSDCDVAIVDIGLPDGDGWEFMRRAELPKGVYAIAMSGFGLGRDRGKSQAAGFRHHLLKPFDPDDLDRMLDEAAREKATG